ncbi:zinc metalloprotease [Sphingomonas sp. MAH-20]|jgi:predicted metalloprotease|uniref:Zinc metalloprotease n=1 Tax=Sphingomonas horti TaxID=2682842 RepID=A0A6I4J420_9SPHN|nr:MULTISPECIES: neutral zinc metallopeptidase [Sphingomonas]MBA2919152.1 neutral zinc metallopeptidase [Sphingomonas sp. CGMCC 1.13658]MVO79185.1 zinc metalloprotease [Sphingomonas horti]
MRLDDYRTSDNVGDQRGQSFGGGGFGGGGGLGLILGLVGSRFGIGGVAVVLIGAWLLGLFGSGGGQQAISPQEQAGGKTAAQICSVDAASRFSCQVLASTEDTWGRIFQQSGARYTPTTLIFYSGRGQSGCGAAQSAMGPFYCPTDKKVYLDTDFYRELSQRFGAAGDFAQAYVIAHEVGHHVQDLQGTLEQAHELQARSGEAEGNAIQVRVELQADCYAGVWAAANKDRLEPGDVEEGMRAAHQIGDDVLQQASQGRVVPESFTHGTAEQRMAWLRKGIQTGDPAQCDTFSGPI